MYERSEFIDGRILRIIRESLDNRGFFAIQAANSLDSKRGTERMYFVFGIHVFVYYGNESGMHSFTNCNHDYIHREGMRTRIRARKQTNMGRDGRGDGAR